MSGSDVSSLSSAESIESDEELKSATPRKGTIDRYFQHAKTPPSPPKRKRPASPPHEYLLADNPDIAFIVMFRARFNDALPKSLPNFGPQDIEKGIGGTQPEENIERLLCALIGLCLNRKKDVEVYRENNPALKNRTWWSVADSIESVKGLAEKLREEGSQKGSRLANSMQLAVPRFEAGEEKRKRRDYRLARKAQFARVEPGMSLYEGRTRGKRIRYTFSDDEDMGSDGISIRRSRNSGFSTPAEPAGPVVTASGRHIKPRAGGVYGESLLSSQHGESAQVFNDAASGQEPGQELLNRTRGSADRASRARRAYRGGYNAVDEMGDESDTPSSEWNSGKEDDNVEDDDISNEGFDEDDDVEAARRSLIVSLKIGQANATALKAKTPHRIGPEEHFLLNGSSPAESTIVVNNQQSKLNGDIVMTDTQPSSNPADTSSFNSITPLSGPVEAPTPLLSDTKQSLRVEIPPMLPRPADIGYLA
ncbi:MAG: hypothetical protein LQ340_002311 [Diploschistes diacapsis]|nr:MAG: hypothetical protein LQ340_002311 [Diploschistes diacapsis]